MLKFIGNIFLGTLSIAIMLIGCEWAAKHFYEDLTPDGGRKVISRVLSNNLSKTDWLYYKSHPYMLYMLAPNMRDTNSKGYRGREFKVMPANNRLRVLALGGSTTWGQGAKHYHQAWPAKLEREFLQRGMPVEVINGGFPAATSAELAAHYAFRHRDYKPDIVILHVGWNDTLPLLVSPYFPSYDDYRGWKSPPLALRSGERTLLKSAIIRIGYAWWFQNTALDQFIISNDRYHKLDPEEAFENASVNYPDGFERNVENIIDLARAHGAKVILFPTTVAWDTKIFERTPAKDTERIWPALMVSLKKNRSVLRKLAKKKKAFLFELRDELIPLKEFIDHAHTSPHGHLLKARFLVANICSSLKNIPFRVELKCVD